MNTWIVCAATCAFVLLLAACSSNGADEATSSQVEPTLSASAGPTASPATPSPTKESWTPTATSTSAPTALPTPAPTADTRVPIRDLPTAGQIQLGKAGKYFVADRGDGCTWVEYLRENRPEIGLKVFLRTDCPADFGITFQPESGIVLRLS